MDSLGSNHSIPSMSVSTGSQSSSVNSMQEVMDESSSELVTMHDDESTSISTSSVVHKKVMFSGALPHPPQSQTTSGLLFLLLEVNLMSILWPVLGGEEVQGPLPIVPNICF